MYLLYENEKCTVVAEEELRIACVRLSWVLPRRSKSSGREEALDCPGTVGLSVLALTGVPVLMPSCYGGRTARSAEAMSSLDTAPADGT